MERTYNTIFGVKRRCNICSEVKKEGWWNREVRRRNFCNEVKKEDWRGGE
jgi:hypothetical protein